MDGGKGREVRGMNEFAQVNELIESYEIPDGWMTAGEMLAFIPVRFQFSAFGKIGTFEWLKKNPDQLKRIEYDMDENGDTVSVVLYSPLAQRHIINMLKDKGPLVYTAGGWRDTYAVP